MIYKPKSVREGLISVTHYLQTWYFKNKHFSSFSSNKLKDFEKSLKRNNDLINLLEKMEANFSLLKRSDTLYQLTIVKSSSSRLVWFLNNIPSIKNEIAEENDKISCWYFGAIYSMLLLMSVDFTSIPSRLKKYLPSNLTKGNAKSSSWFRGQANAEWGLLPSLYREWKMTFTHNVIDFGDVSNFYEKTKLVSKYDSTFKVPFDKDKLGFLAYIQHATSCSPLLDFTEDFHIAAVFASYTPGNHLLVENHDGLVLAVPQQDQMDAKFSGSTKQEKIKWAIDNFSICLLEKTVYPTTTIFNQPLFLLPITALMPNYVVLEEPTNDRMKYQKGVLFFFYHCVIFGGTILFPFSNQYGSQSLFVGRIKKGSGKKTCYRRITKAFPQLEYRHLFDPYSYFMD